MIDVVKELRKARREGYALPAFNTNNLEVTKAICRAAMKYDHPILIQTTPSAIEYAGLEQIFDIVKNEIKDTGIKAAIHVDHGKDFEVIRRAIGAGWRSVMFDGSKYDFAENVAMTEKVVRYAHKFDASVEGEIGVIGREEGGQVSGKAVYSAPEEVAKFIHMTGVDSIAVSVGNEHGAPAGEKLDLKLLEKIAHVVEIPLVMHGASGLHEGELREAITMGVAKINIDTNIRKAFAGAIESSDAADYRDALKEGMEEVEKVVEHYIELFGGKKR
jgi:fructose-bisphosphate aldolase class II